jgi:hypothetical protein
MMQSVFFETIKEILVFDFFRLLIFSFAGGGGGGGGPQFFKVYSGEEKNKK